MINNGMHVGGHGYDHMWLDTLTPEEQTTEIKRTTEFLSALNVSTENWVMSYPYGSHNKTLIEALKANKCKMAFTIKTGIANLTTSNVYTLERLNTNDLPKIDSASPNKWTRQILE